MAALGAAELPPVDSTSYLGASNIGDDVDSPSTLWPKDSVQEGEAIVEELREDVFSVTNLIVDDDFKLKMDASLVIMITLHILLQVSGSRLPAEVIFYNLTSTNCF